MKQLIWYEKYRPQALDQLILPRTHTRSFNKFIRQAQIPHLLFYGPAGSGKTTLSQILINECAGRSLILNASSEDRGIATIKMRVKQFAASQKIKEKLNVVFFDEANGLTADAQEALKNTIERYQRNCRFIFTTNEIDKITEAIFSRCQVFKFDSFPKKDLRLHLANILKKESIRYQRKDLRHIVNRYYPDVRTIINAIQSCSISGTLNLDSTMAVTDYNLLASHIQKGRIMSSRKMLAGGKDFLGIYRYLFDTYIPQRMDDEAKSEAAITVAEYLYRDRSVVDKEINMTACLLELMSLNGVEANFSA